jgi:predicted transcriptional regulator
MSDAPDSPPAQHTEWAVLELLLDSQRPWSISEIQREIGEEIATTDAIANLHAAGLAHRTTDNFIFATRAAVRYYELVP